MAAKRARSPYYNGPPRPPTARQRDFLRAVRELWEELGEAPNATQIAAQLGIRQTSARQQLKALEKRGYLRDVPKSVSSGRWALTDTGSIEIGDMPGWKCPACDAANRSVLLRCAACGAVADAAERSRQETGGLVKPPCPVRRWKSEDWG